MVHITHVSHIYAHMCIRIHMYASIHAFFQVQSECVHARDLMLSYTCMHKLPSKNFFEGSLRNSSKEA